MKNNNTSLRSQRIKVDSTGMANNVGLYSNFGSYIGVDKYGDIYVFTSHLYSTGNTYIITGTDGLRIYSKGGILNEQN